MPVDAPPPRRPADRPLCHDMHYIGRKVAERPTYPRPGCDRQPDLAIAGHGHIEELVRRYHRHLMPPLLKLGDGRLQRAHNTVYLRHPRVGRDRNPHAATTEAGAAATSPLT